MLATVTRVGTHQGQLFAEVEHRPDGAHGSPLKYAVPLSAEVPVGSVVEISVELKGVPKTPATTVESAPVGAPSRPQFAVPTSPNVAGTSAAAVDTSPSGQSQGMPPTAESKPELAQASAAGVNLGDTGAGGGGEGSSAPKQGRLPKSFPHHDELEAADITTYAQVRALNGDYREVHGIGEVKGKEIDEALGG